MDEDFEKIESAEVLRHPLETLDGDPLYVVEYYDKNGKTLLVEHFRSKTSAYLAAMAVVDSKII